MEEFKELKQKFPNKISSAECGWHEDAFRINVSERNHRIAWGLPWVAGIKQPQPWAGIRSHRTNPSSLSRHWWCGNCCAVVWVQESLWEAGHEPYSGPTPGPLFPAWWWGWVETHLKNIQLLWPSSFHPARGSHLPFSPFEGHLQSQSEDLLEGRHGSFFQLVICWQSVCVLHALCMKGAPASPASSRQATTQHFNLPGSTSAWLFSSFSSHQI